jgi:hypothetical protein
MFYVEIPLSVSCLITKPIANGIAQTSLERPLKKPIIEWVKMARSSVDITTMGSISR